VPTKLVVNEIDAKLLLNPRQVHCGDTTPHMDL